MTGPFYPPRVTTQERVGLFIRSHTLLWSIIFVAVAMTGFGWIVTAIENRPVVINEIKEYPIFENCDEPLGLD